MESRMNPAPCGFRALSLPADAAFRLARERKVSLELNVVNESPGLDCDPSISKLTIASILIYRSPRRTSKIGCLQRERENVGVVLAARVNLTRQPMNSIAIDIESVE